MFEISSLKRVKPFILLWIVKMKYDHRLPTSSVWFTVKPYIFVWQQKVQVIIWLWWMASQAAKRQRLYQLIRTSVVTYDSEIEHIEYKTIMQLFCMWACLIKVMFCCLFSIMLFSKLMLLAIDVFIGIQFNFRFEYHHMIDWSYQNKLFLLVMLAICFILLSMQLQLQCTLI